MTSAPVPLNDAEAEKITRTLTARSEWLGFAAQTLAIGTSLVVDKLPTVGKAVVGAFLIIHLTLAVLSRLRGKGPFTAGPPWGAVWLACCALVPVMMALLVAPGDYGSAAQCVQMCAYPIGPVAMFAFFPWGLSGRSWRRVPVQILTIAGIVVEPLVVILLINGGIATVNLQSVAFSALLVVLAFLAGLEVKRICMGSSTLHFEGLESAYRRQQRTLHDLVRTTITSAKTAAARGDTSAVTGALEALSAEVGKVEYDLSVATPDINVLRVLRRLRDEHSDRVRLDVPQGAGELPQRVGELIVRCARNLVDNAVRYGLAGVEVHFRVESRRAVAVLSVADNGPGFDAREFDNEATTLHDLRQEARAQGGDMLVRRHGERNEVLVFASLQAPR